MSSLEDENDLTSGDRQEETTLNSTAESGKADEEAQRVAHFNQVTRNAARRLEAFSEQLPKNTGIEDVKQRINGMAAIAAFNTNEFGIRIVEFVGPVTQSLRVSLKEIFDSIKALAPRNDSERQVLKELFDSIHGSMGALGIPVPWTSSNALNQHLSGQKVKLPDGSESSALVTLIEGAFDRLLAKK